MACVFPRPAKDSLELIYPGVAANPCCGDSPSPPQRWGSERDLAKRKSTLLERLTRWAKKGMGEADWELGTVGTQLAGEDTLARSPPSVGQGTRLGAKHIPQFGLVAVIISNWCLNEIRWELLSGGTHIGVVLHHTNDVHVCFFSRRLNWDLQMLSRGLHCIGGVLCLIPSFTPLCPQKKGCLFSKCL